MQRLGWLLTGLLVLGLAPCASAATGPMVTIDNAKPSLEKDGDHWKVALGFTNVTNSEVQLTLASSTPAVDAGCAVTFAAGAATKAIAAARHDTAELDFGAGCAIPKTGVTFALTASSGGNAGAPPQKLDQLSAAPKPPAAADWKQLKAFPIAWLLGIVLLTLAAIGIKVGTVRKWGMPLELKSLPATWTFDDSWVTNITLLGGALTTVVGSSEVVKAILGEDSDASIALATVGAAIAAVIIGLGAIFLQLSRKVEGDDDVFRGWGLVLAGGATLGGAYGELWVVWKMADKLGLGAAQDWVTGAAIGTGLLLALYAIRNLRATIQVGAAPVVDPPIEVPDSAAVGAVLLEHFQLKDNKSPAELLAEIQALLAAQAAAAKAKADAATAAGATAPPPHAKPRGRRVAAMI